MKECGVYRVTGRPPFDKFRGHKPGDVFVAQLNRGQEARAIARGSIERIGTEVLKVEEHEFPRGWLQPEESTDQRGPETGLSH